MARSGRPGRVVRGQRADRMGPGHERALEDPPSRRRHVLAHRLERSDLRDRGRRGRADSRSAGGQASLRQGRGLGAPGQCGGGPETHAEGGGARRGVRKDPVGSDRLRRPRVRRPPSPQQLCGPDAGDRRRDGLRVLRSRGSLRVRRRRQPGVEGRREVRDARSRHGYVAGASREPGDRAARRPQWHPLRARGVRQEDRQGDLADEAPGRLELGDAGDPSGRRPRRARDQRERAHHRVRSGHRARAVADARVSRATRFTRRSPAMASSS